MFRLGMWKVLENTSISELNLSLIWSSRPEMKGPVDQVQRGTWGQVKLVIFNENKS